MKCMHTIQVNPSYATHHALALTLSHIINYYKPLIFFLPLFFFVLSVILFSSLSFNFLLLFLPLFLLLQGASASCRPRIILSVWRMRNKYHRPLAPTISAVEHIRFLLPVELPRLPWQIQLTCASVYVADQSTPARCLRVHKQQVSWLAMC